MTPIDWIRRRLGGGGLEPLHLYQFTPLPREGYLVGGALRDALLGRPFHDIDWLVPDPKAAAQQAAETLGGSFFALDEDRGHWRVVAGEQVRDYTPLTEALEDNLWQRDYTLNALAVDRQGVLIDPTGGLRDLRARRLRMTRRRSLSADALRPLRGVRLQTQLGLTLDGVTREAIEAEARAQHLREHPLPAWERIGDELNRLLNLPNAAEGIERLDTLGLANVYLEELTPMHGVEQGGYHHLDVFDHSVEALRQLLLGFPDASLSLRWATLLHDVGKPATLSFEDGTRRPHFYTHHKVGAEITARLLRRLRQPRERVTYASQLVHYHMLPLPDSPRSARRFVHRRYDLLPDLLSLMVADREASRGPQSSTAARQAYRKAVSQVLAVMDAPPPKKPLLSGHEVMEVLEIGPGPRIGQALDFLKEAEAVDDIHNRDEAVEALRHFAHQKGWLDESV